MTDGDDGARQQPGDREIEQRRPRDSAKRASASTRCIRSGVSPCLKYSRSVIRVPAGGSRPSRYFPVSRPLASGK